MFEAVLSKHHYRRQGRAAKGLLRRFLQEELSGLSRAQIPRWSG